VGALKICEAKKLTRLYDANGKGDTDENDRILIVSTCVLVNDLRAITRPKRGREGGEPTDITEYLLDGRICIFPVTRHICSTHQSLDA
jgi:hypothetical protein